MNARWLLVLSLVVLGVASACGDSASADEPPTIHYGEDSCNRCHMIISEERFAAGLVDAEGESRIFDDVGELVLTVQQEGLGNQRAWVHDFDSHDWVNATEAYFVDSHDIVTPMGMGVVAFATRDAAEAAAAEHHGTVRDWNAMLAEWTMHGHDH